MRNERIQQLVTVAVLMTVALMLSWLESFVPLPAGLHLGLSNFPVVLVLYGWGFPAALGFGILKSILSLLFLGRLSSLFYSLGGICLAVCAMGLCKRCPCFSLLGVNAAGAVFHGVGQLLVAGILLETVSLWSMLPFLTVGGLCSSFLTFFPLQTVLKRGFLPRKIE